MQWVVDGYTLPLAGLLLLGGALGDVYGRRKVFVIGTIWFALASLACGLAPDAGFLIAARAVQGAGAALLTPGSLAILQASFSPDDRSRAIGAWSGLGGVATAIGPFLGGWLIGAVSWRLVFFINLPVAAAVVAIAVRHVPESRAPGPRQPLDAAGAVTISLALAGITYGLIAASADGWTSPRVLASLLAGARPARGLLRHRDAQHASDAAADDLPQSASSARRTPSPSWSTARSAAPCSWCRSCFRRSAATARWRPGWRCCR